MQNGGPRTLATFSLSSYNSFNAYRTSFRFQRTPAANRSSLPASVPTLTNHRQRILSNNDVGRSRNGGLIGRRKKRVVYAQKTEAGNGIVYNSCRPAPQRPPWWLWRGQKVEKSEEQPLNPLHRLEKFSWIGLFGGDTPMEKDSDDSVSDGRRTDKKRFSLFSAKKSSASPLEQDMSTRSTTRFLQAAKALHGRKKGERIAFSALLSEEQKLEIVNREIESKWWARFWYKPFRNISEHRLRSTKRWLHVVLTIVLLSAFGIVMFLYYKEILLIDSLSPEDKVDYIYLVRNMRYSDFLNMAMEVLQKEDPLEALPPPARYHVALEEARRRGLTSEVDWESLHRERHPASAFEEFDFVHVFYWFVMYLGNLFYGGGGLFSSRLLGTEAVAKAEGKKAVIREEPAFIGPTAPPPSYADTQTFFK